MEVIDETSDSFDNRNAGEYSTFVYDEIYKDFKMRLGEICDRLPLPDDEQNVLRSRLLDRYFGLGKYLSENSMPFFCDLKARYEDFHVYEISGYGWGLTKRPQVHLTSLKVEDDDDSKWLPPKTTIQELDWQDSDVLIQQIKQFSEDKVQTETCLTIPELTKDQRTKLHQFIRQEFTNCESSTINKDGKVFLKLCRKRRKDSDGNQIRADKRWPPGKPDYYRFVLYKENVDTESAIRAIAGNMDIKRFAYCGTKDRRGITTQYVTGYRIRPSEVAKNANRLNKKLNGHGRVEVGHFELVEEKLYLGHHCGNAFKIFLRNVRPLERDRRQLKTQEMFITNVIDSVRNLSKTGFINYFGTQRFGSMSMDNHLVGLQILKKNYEKAVLMILKPRDGDNQRNEAYNKAMNHFAETRHADEAFKMLDSRSKTTVEGRLLQALTKNNNNYLNSLMTGMSRNMRMLYVHAFQSYIWNLLASFRHFIAGTKVLVGDIVYSKTGKNITAKKLGLPTVEDSSNDDELSWMKQTQTELCQQTRIILSDDHEAESCLTEEEIIKDKSGMIFIDENTINNYSIEDVYIPIVSYDTKIPNNIIGSFLRSTLKIFGLEMDDFKSLTKEWCIEGSYRKFIGKMKNFSCLPFLYSKENQPNMSSDLDIIKSKTNDSSIDNDEKKEEKIVSDLLPEEKEIGLLLCFSLDIGQYATVALRELTKLGTLSIENRKFNPRESIKNILRHSRLRQKYVENFDLLSCDNTCKTIEEKILKDILEDEKKDPLTNAGFDEFYRIVECQLKNSDPVADSVDNIGPSDSKKIKLDSEI